MGIQGTVLHMDLKLAGVIIHNMLVSEKELGGHGFGNVCITIIAILTLTIDIC